MSDATGNPNSEELPAGEFVVQVFEHAVRVQPWSDGYAVARLKDLHAFGLTTEDLLPFARGDRTSQVVVGLDDLSDGIDRQLRKSLSDSRLLRAHGLLSNLIEQAHEVAPGALRKRAIPSPSPVEAEHTEGLLMISLKGNQLDIAVHPFLMNIAQAELEQLLVRVNAGCNELGSRERLQHAVHEARVLLDDATEGQGALVERNAVSDG